jgi:hypothetical protein
MAPFYGTMNLFIVNYLEPTRRITFGVMTRLNRGKPRMFNVGERFVYVFDVYSLSMDAPNQNEC